MFSSSLNAVARTGALYLQTEKQTTPGLKTEHPETVYCRVVLYEDYVVRFSSGWHFISCDYAGC